jgi:hypothetical protein
MKIVVQRLISSSSSSIFKKLNLSPSANAEVQFQDSLSSFSVYETSFF